MLVKTFAAAVHGVDAQTITVEINTGGNVAMGSQFYFMVGLPDSAVREGSQRIEAALKNSGFKMLRVRTVVNLAPADIRKEGSAYDLPIAIGYMAATDQLICDNLDNYLIMGELSLDGGLRPIKGALPIAIQARKEKFKGIILPKQNAREAALVSDLEVYGVENLSEAVGLLNGEAPLQQPVIVNTREEFFNNISNYSVDFSDVKGQENIKRALELAAAGGHNAILIGPPGAGKTMLARRLPTIIPPLSLHEALETTKIHSVAGMLPSNAALITTRPFRAPHHTISDVALVGGGTNLAGAQRRAVFGRAAGVQTQCAGSVATAHGRAPCDHFSGQIFGGLPRRIHAHRLHEPLSLRVLQPPRQRMCVRPRRGEALPEQDFRSAARPH